MKQSSGLIKTRKLKYVRKQKQWMLSQIHNQDWWRLWSSPSRSNESLKLELLEAWEPPNS